MNTDVNMTEDHWESFYREKGQIWTGSVNELLAREVGHLTPGTALDLGCGEGGDALWLAAQGWTVTAVDVSSTALARGAARATDAGLAARIDWKQHDLARSFPTGTFDLVSAMFLHSAVAADGERHGILSRAAEAVAPGGVLLIVGHGGWATWQHDHPHADHHFDTNAELLESLDLGPRWTVEVDDTVERDMVGPNGEQGTRSDHVLRLRLR
ncbi:SAM-dependent methyltransferase [Saccharothrix sp. NRRL B-16314]|uniref:SAM-dependent methyltransferase n=1 Tax=Saccharothrix sp. NRRL B-16314 TaxID=1463825 RepID=UPI00052594D2|nr:class I SAM-dependent methyltransferase [Saccharothrix sp. NRRL B-16314]